MFPTSKTLGLAALFLLLAAALYILSPIAGGFGREVFMLMPVGVVFAALGVGLLRGLRLIAWLAFFAALIAGIVALAAAMDATALPGSWHGLIMAADWAAAVFLFLYLWGTPAARRGET